MYVVSGQATSIIYRVLCHDCHCSRESRLFNTYVYKYHTDISYMWIVDWSTGCIMCIHKLLHIHTLLSYIFILHFMWILDDPRGACFGYSLRIIIAHSEEVHSWPIHYVITFKWFCIYLTINNIVHIHTLHIIMIETQHNMLLLCTINKERIIICPIALTWTNHSYKFVYFLISNVIAYSCICISITSCIFIHLHINNLIHIHIFE